MLHLQEYLRGGGNLNLLRGEPYCLQIKEEGNLVILKYNQLTSDFSEPMVKEARGIIFFRPTWDVVCFPFTKFFNESEEHAAKLDESELHIYQKVDGSLAKVWYFEGSWHLSSNSIIDASEVNLSSGVNFQTLFMRCLAHYGLDWESFTSDLNPDYTYMYEIASPDNRVVIEYKDYYLFYLGQRNIHTYVEEYVPDSRIDNVKVYKFNSIEEIIAAAKELPDSEEGYVVRDKNWNRVKIKNPTYFMLHKIANNGKPDFLQYVLEHNEDELLAYFPNYKTDIEKVKEYLRLLERRAYMHIERLSVYYSLTRPEFAKVIFNSGVPSYYQSFIFKTYENRQLTWKEYTQDWDIFAWRRVLDRAEKDLSRCV